LLNSICLDTSQRDLYNNVKNITSKGKIRKFFSLLRVILVKFLQEPDLKNAISQPKIIQNEFLIAEFYRKWIAKLYSALWITIGSVILF
jgi:hypothetical protein